MLKHCCLLNQNVTPKKKKKKRGNECFNLFIKLINEKHYFNQRKTSRGIPLLLLQYSS